jgi:hypothetical protein
MNLTVGPLSPAVYWRRRAVVAGGLLLLILLVVYSCGGSSGSGAANRASSATSPSSSPSPTPSELHPVIGGSPASDPSDPSDPGGSPSTAPAGPAVADPGSELCTDGEILLTPSVQRIVGGTYAYELTLKIKNTSTRSCKRDVGSNPQELHITQNGQTLWSSDACQVGAGQNNVVTFGPGIEDSFKIGWDGTAGQSCTGGRALAAGTYQIVAKLDTKVSSPVTFTVVGK